MTVRCVRALICAALVVGLSSLVLAQASDVATCRELFSRAAAQLASEQYELMLTTAEKHMRQCAGPRSALLVGLAEANRVDALLIVDPPQRERTRLRALRYLRIAATHGQRLPSEWLLSIGEWIVSLQQRGPAARGLSSTLEEASLGVDKGSDRRSLPAPEHWPIQQAPPPRAAPEFPWGPVIAVTAGGIALTTSLGLALTANDRFAAVRVSAEELQLHREELADESYAQRLRIIEGRERDAEAFQDWATLLAIGGAAAVGTGLVWYWLFPPEGKWRWAATPAGLQAMVRF